MNENQESLDIGIGNKEPKKLEPAEVVIASVAIKDISKDNKKKLNKVIFSCIHPDKKDDPFNISSVKIERNKKLTVAATWYILQDKEEDENEPDQLKKNSVIAEFMRFMKVDTLKDFIGKKCMTTTDENEYLVFKSY